MTAIVKRVEICGGIAAGKTTLARLLRSKILTPIYEDFKKNPFYDAFYEDPRRYAFETELTFLLQHYHQQKAMASKNRDFCADFSWSWIAPMRGYSDCGRRKNIPISSCASRAPTSRSQFARTPHLRAIRRAKPNKASTSPLGAEHYFRISTSDQ